jgi:tRNA(adenine34) deaminase
VADNYRLPGAILYVTLEPCTMCAGAMIHARIEQLVFAAKEPKAGVVCSTCSLLDEPRYNHAVNWRGGVLAEESSQRLQDFFQARRSERE